MGRFAAMCLLVACGGGAGSPDGTSGGSADAPVIPTPASCTVPPEGMLVDTSAATNIVGDGSPGSCTEAALRTAVTAGGLIKFSCGPDPVTITVTSPIVINNVAGADGLGDTVLDGGGTVTLSGGGTTRILTVDACSPPFNSPHCDTFPHPHLTVERLTLTKGHDESADGGGAILRKGGALTVIDSVLTDNEGAVTGQDTAGGALRLIYATPALIVGTQLTNNRCSDGGAIGSLQASPVTVINSVVDGNTATGNGGNPGNGGNGGGIYHDGVMLDLELCGVQVTHNHGNAFGGGMFYVDDAGQGTVKITDTEISDNDIPIVSGMPSHGGAAYLQGADITFANTTVADNSAGFAAGLFVNGMSGHGSLNATNLTVTGMMGDGMTIDSSIAGTLLASTIANNTRGMSGAAGMALVDTIVANNSGSSCDAPAKSATASLQFPDGSCGATMADPGLATLADNGGAVRTIAVSATGAAAGIGTSCPPTDARGTTRPQTGCTSGAYQLP